MIIVFHKQNKALSAYDYQQQKEVLVDKQKTVFYNLKKIAKQHPNRVIGWCLIALKKNLNVASWKNIFHHQHIWASYALNSNFCFHKNLGYVDQSIFINVNKENTYPTWISSTDVGATSAYVFNQVNIKNEEKFSLLFLLNAVAKKIMPLGVFCYSEPNLVNKKIAQPIITDNEVNEVGLLLFIRTFYKKSWLLIYIFNNLIYKKRLPLLKLAKSLLKQPVIIQVIPFSKAIQSIKKPISKENFTVDVLIPTLGRKKYLYDVLQDLAQQTLLPKKVIIVEQNADKKSVSELDYLKDSWPFKIDHTFTHQLGACNARNIALSKVTANWVFFADDDIRFEEMLLKKSLSFINCLGLTAFTFSSLQKFEIETGSNDVQWGSFGTNSSIVKTSFLKNIEFKKEHEFGYGEDSDFGLQLRNIGCDIIYSPFIKSLHLKAPSGGFRFKYVPKWSEELILPKPSPTVMAFHLKHQTKEQLQGYKTILFSKFYKRQRVKNPIKYIGLMKKQWNSSVFWAKKMMEDEI